MRYNQYVFIAATLREITGFKPIGFTGLSLSKYNQASNTFDPVDGPNQMQASFDALVNELIRHKGKSLYDFCFNYAAAAAWPVDKLCIRLGELTGYGPSTTL